MHLFQSLEEVTMLLLKLDKEHFPVIFGVEIVGEQIVYLLIKGDQSFLCIPGTDIIYHFFEFQNEFVLVDDK